MSDTRDTLAYIIFRYTGLDYWVGEQELAAADEILKQGFIDRIKAEAWQECEESAYYDPEVRGQVSHAPNPYKGLKNGS